MLFRLTNPLPFLIEKDCVYCEIEAEYIKVLTIMSIYFIYKANNGCSIAVYPMFAIHVSRFADTVNTGKYDLVGIAVPTCKQNGSST
jgi:hypothetical protein